MANIAANLRQLLQVRKMLYRETLQGSKDGKAPSGRMTQLRPSIAGRGTQGKTKKTPARSGR